MATDRGRSNGSSRCVIGIPRSIGAWRCCATTRREPERLVHDSRPGHLPVPVHFALVIDLDPDRIARLSMRHSDRPQRDILFAYRRPDGGGHKADIVAAGTIVRIY